MRSVKTIAVFTALVLLMLAIVPAQAAQKRSYTVNYIIPDSDTRALKEKDLQGYTRETLRYIRNEILARHGYAFSLDKFYNYFNAKSWYEAGGYGTRKVLTNVEWNNISLIKRVERQWDNIGYTNPSGLDISTIVAWQNKKGGFGDQNNYGNLRGTGNGLTTREDYGTTPGPKPTVHPIQPKPNYIYTRQEIIPDSDTRNLTENELWAYTRETLRYIRNELLARHGYSFKTGKFAEYFGGKSWYKAGGYNDNLLDKTEWRNVSLIKKVERAMDEMGTQNKNGLDIETIIKNQKKNKCPGDK